MKCTNCGSIINDDAAFCSECGARIADQLSGSGEPESPDNSAPVSSEAPPDTGVFPAESITPDSDTAVENTAAAESANDSSPELVPAGEETVKTSEDDIEKGAEHRVPSAGQLSAAVLKLKELGGSGLMLAAAILSAVTLLFAVFEPVVNYLNTDYGYYFILSEISASLPGLLIRLLITISLFDIYFSSHKNTYTPKCAGISILYVLWIINLCIFLLAFALMLFIFIALIFIPTAFLSYSIYILILFLSIFGILILLTLNSFFNVRFYGSLRKSIAGNAKIKSAVISSIFNFVFSFMFFLMTLSELFFYTGRGYLQTLAYDFMRTTPFAEYSGQIIIPEFTILTIASLFLLFLYNLICGIIKVRCKSVTRCK